MVAVSDNSLDLAGSTTTASPGVAPARATEDRTTTTSRTTEDVSGPCDEAEHANDPRCKGAGKTRRDDRHRNRGGSTTQTTTGHDANDDRVTGVDDGDHRGGSNSGPGGSSGSNSGPGGGGGHGGHGRDHAEDD